MPKVSKRTPKVSGLRREAESLLAEVEQLIAGTSVFLESFEIPQQTRDMLEDRAGDHAMISKMVLDGVATWSEIIERLEALRYNVDTLRQNGQANLDHAKLAAAQGTTRKALARGVRRRTERKSAEPDGGSDYDRVTIAVVPALVDDDRFADYTA